MTEQRHPSLEEHTSLPEGLYKGKLRLEKSMLPSIDWAGLGVKASMVYRKCNLPTDHSSSTVFCRGLRAIRTG